MRSPALRVFAALMTAVMAVSVSPCPQVFADKNKQPKIEKAAFSSYELVTFEGGIIRIGVEGTSFTVSTDAANIFEITLCKADSSSVVRRFKKQSGEFSVDLEGYMDKGKLYFVAISYQLGSKVITQDDNYIFLGDDGQIHFYKSPTYSFNVERCTELRDDEVSLKECLQPQNDIECDDPVIIEYSKQICEGAESDWEKVYHIYTYLIGAMAYDNTQTDKSNKMVYQDGAICLLRRGMAVCEGFGNIFTALCRAQGIPATVEFGVGLACFDEMMADNLEEDETPDHAWAAVYLGGKWRFVDPTYDSGKTYEGKSWDNGKIVEGVPTYNYYLLPLEAFSYAHKICDADTVHGYERSGSCGKDATYTISRDGTLTISGSGTIQMPYGVNGFSKIVFAPGSKITCIGKKCFFDCDLITQVILPDTVTEIGQEAFNSCEDLEYVYLPSGLERIGQEAFDGCDELAFIKVPKSVKRMGSWAFDDCPRLYLVLPSKWKGYDSKYDCKPMHTEFV
ncbi:MAG: leucine-rich repeat protein [Saccharofermentans sp.]|nr:leucine-rich repeat protein [Saccharofermentans sp.]